MSAARFNTTLATRQAVDIRSHRKPSATARRQELELKLTDLQQHYAELRSEMFEAAQVHRRLCAPRQLRFGNFEVASEIFAVRHLPGDFFTVQQQFDGVVFALGDICGKGLAAGMWTTHLVGLVSAYTAETAEPEAIVTALNRDLCRMSSVVPLTSLFLARLDPATGRLDYSNAGHPPPMLLCADRHLEWLSEGGPLLGAIPAASYKSGHVDLRAGDVVLAYTDGILESRNSAAEEFGSDRLEVQLRHSPTSSAQAVLFSMLGAVQDFAATSPLTDDTSLVVVRRGTGEDHT